MTLDELNNAYNDYVRHFFKYPMKIILPYVYYESIEEEIDRHFQTAGFKKGEVKMSTPHLYRGAILDAWHRNYIEIL